MEPTEQTIEMEQPSVQQTVEKHLSESKHIPHNDIDIGFVEEQEGHVDPSLNYIGFVPMKDGKPIGTSGVTVGYGIDIGQQSVSDLDKLGVDDDVIEKVRPYIGLKKEKAVEALKKRPLNLNDRELDQLNEAFLRRDLEKMKDKVGEEYWSSIPREGKTVMLSLVRNFGPGATDFKTFEAIKEGRFKDAVRKLRNQKEWSNRELDARRNREADLLERYLKEGGR